MLEAELDQKDRFHDTLDTEKKKRLRSWDLDLEACEEEKERDVRTRGDILEELRVKVCQYGTSL